MTNEISIRIEDYLDPHEIKDVLRSEIRTYMRNNQERLISNAIYQAVQSEVSAFLSADEEAAGELLEQTENVILNLSSYTVFHPGDKHTGTPTSRGYELLQEAVDTHQNLVFEKVQEIFNDFGVDTVEDLVTEAVRTLLGGRR